MKLATKKIDRLLKDLDTTQKEWNGVRKSLKRLHRRSLGSNLTSEDIEPLELAEYRAVSFQKYFDSASQDFKQWVWDTESRGNAQLRAENNGRRPTTSGEGRL